jgi:hypothetical protein
MPRVLPVMAAPCRRSRRCHPYSRQRMYPRCRGRPISEDPQIERSAVRSQKGVGSGPPIARHRPATRNCRLPVRAQLLAPAVLGVPEAR